MSSTPVKSPQGTTSIRSPMEGSPGSPSKAKLVTNYAELLSPAGQSSSVPEGEVKKKKKKAVNKKPEESVEAKDGEPESSENGNGHSSSSTSEGGSEKKAKKTTDKGTPSKSGTGSKTSTPKSKTKGKAVKASTGKKVKIAGSPTKTPGKDKGSGEEGKSSTAKKGPRPLSASAKKKKLEGLKEKYDSMKEGVDKLKKEKTRLVQKLEKLQAAAHEIKFPVKDELITTIDAKGKPLTPLPEPYVNINDRIPAEALGNTIEVWDFFNTFSKTLGLQTVSWDDFVELLEYRGAASAALSDLFVAPLRLILSDARMAARLQSTLPRRPHYTTRGGAGSADEVEAELAVAAGESALFSAASPEHFDSQYNGLRVLPRGARLRADCVDALRVQAVLRAVFLRLEPVRALRKAVAEATAALSQSLSVSLSRSSSSAGTSSNTSSSTAVERLLQVNREHWCGPTPVKARERPTNAAASLTALDSIAEGEGESKVRFQSPVKDQSNRSAVSSELLSLVHTPKHSHGNRRGGQHGANKDALYSLTLDYVSALQSVYRVVSLLDNTELHALSLADKALLLRTLCQTLYDTQRVQDLLASHAVERQEKLSEFARQARELKAKAKEQSLSKRDAAVDTCRRLNQQALLASGKGGVNAKGKPKKGAGGKDPAEPTADQVAAMIDDLVILEQYGVQTVHEDPAIEEVPSDDEAEGERDDGEGERERLSDDEDSGRGPSRRLTAQARAKALDRRRQILEINARNTALASAMEKLTYALETKSDKDLRSAIRVGERAGFKGVDERGRVFCTQTLKQVYKQLHELSTKAKEDKVATQREKTLQDCFIATDPIGLDRSHSLYWLFTGDDNKLFVETRDSTDCEYDGPVPPRGEDEVVQRLFLSRPSRVRSGWKVYCSGTELWRLCEALDERGERERALKAAIHARFDLEECPDYLRTGSAYLGRKVTRKFGKRTVIGTIVAWLPATAEDAALWHVLHVDGDEEDLEEHEILSTLVPLPGERDTTAEVEGETMQVEGERDTVNDVVIEDEPRLVRQQGGLSRSRNALSSTFVGVAGLQTELIRLLGTLVDPLKKLGAPITRETRKQMETNIRDACTVSELGACVTEVEKCVRASQQCEDKRDAEEAARQREREIAREREAMVAEGWVFEQGEGVRAFIGRRARRFFRGFGASDGTVRAFFPAECNDGIALYRLEHDDGDKEDLDAGDLDRALRQFDDDVQEGEREGYDDDEEGQEDEGPDDGESDGDSDGDSESQADEGQSDDEGPSDSAGVRLWPTAEARERWLSAVSASQTVSELSLAVSALEEHCHAYGVLDSVDPFQPLSLYVVPGAAEAEARAQRKAAAASSYVVQGGGRHAMLSPRKAKKRAMSEISRCHREEDALYEEEDEPRRGRPRSTGSNSGGGGARVAPGGDYYVSGRPSRHAAQKVISYAE